MSVLFTDSDCELWHDELEKLNVKNIDMPFTIDGVEYMYDLGKTTNFEDFYSKLRKGKNGTTSALNTENYKEIFEPVFAAGEDVLYISFSHAMSGTFNQLRIAVKELKEKYPERKFTMFNTNCISTPSAIHVKEAARLKAEGKSDEKIVEHLKKFSSQVCCYMMVDSLMHLKRGGRLSATAAVAGSILSIKPLLTFDENGSLKVFNKVIGRKAAINFLTNKLLSEALDDEKYEAYIMDADCRPETQAMLKVVREKRPNLNVKLQTIGPVVGCHCGPGLVAVSFVGKERPIAINDVDKAVEVF